MKKLTIAILMTLCSYSLVSAEIGVNVGISGNMGVFTAEAEETMGTAGRRGSERATSVFGYGSIFLEKELGQYLRIGVDYNPEDMDSEATSHDKLCADVGSETATCDQKAKVRFTDLTTFYAAVNVTENFFIKAGMVEVDVITLESLGTGGTYGNTSLEGTMMGVGYNKDLTNGLFVRAEGSYTDFDDIKINGATGETRFIKANGIAGVNGKISIGKTF